MSRTIVEKDRKLQHATTEMFCRATGSKDDLEIAMNGPVFNFSIVLSIPFLIWMATTLMIFRRSPKLCHSHVQAKTGFLTANHIFVSKFQSLMGQFRQKNKFRQCCFKVIDIDGVASVLQLFKVNLLQISLLLCKKNFLSFQITAAKGYHCCLFVAQPHYW